MVLRVMTNEAGVIHGDLRLTLQDRQDGLVDVYAAYNGSPDIYTVTGSPVKASHDTIIAMLSANQGRDAMGNRIASDLTQLTHP